MAGERDLNRGKLKELMLLLAARSADDPRMSRVKWNKLLYRADFESFRLLGKSMTGATYLRGEHGPMVKDLPIYEEELGAAGRLRWETDTSGKFPRKIPLAQGDSADTRQFTEEELAVIDRALAELREQGGKGASDWSHEQSAGWQVRENGQEIPYASAFVSTQPLTEEQMARALERSRTEDWNAVRP